MRFDARQLNAFSAVVSQASFTAAAAQLNLSLGAVSLRVKALEEQMGQRLLTRAKTVQATAAGRALMAHIAQVELLQVDLVRSFQPQVEGLTPLAIAVNADSIASWFLPGIQDALREQGVALDVHLDDQDHTLALLKEGAVVGCLSTQHKAVAGCRALPLGAMRYRCIAAPQVLAGLKSKSAGGTSARGGLVRVHDLLQSPAVCFNRKDRLQDQFLATHFGLKHVSYPRHYLPAVDAFHLALLQGMGWGMESTLQYPEDFKSKRLVEVFPGKYVDVPLYWQHYEREGLLASRLTKSVVSVARKRLIQL